MATAGSRRCPNGLRRPPASAGPTRRSPGCAPAPARSRRRRPPTARGATVERADTRRARPPDLTAGRATVAPRRSTTAAARPLTAPTIGWRVRRVRRRRPLRSPAGRVTRRRRQRAKWRRRARSGGTGRGTGGRSGSCCPRTTPTLCLRRWCDLRDSDGFDQTQVLPAPPINPWPDVIPSTNPPPCFACISALLLFTCAAAALYGLVHPRATIVFLV